MNQRVYQYIRETHMIERGDIVLAGVSGGADSVCLFYMLRELVGTYDIDLRVLHVEHGIRGEESLEDAAFVEKLCSKCKVPYTCVHVDVPGYAKAHGLGLEEAARILRYEAFRREANRLLADSGQEMEQRKEQKPGARRIRIALAHHMDDNAETILFQMARGAGLTGLTGMQPVRREGELTYIRPLLILNRREIEAELAALGQTYRVDSTNADEGYSRNRIRSQVLPELTRVNDRAVDHINRAAGLIREAEDYLLQETGKLEEKLVSYSMDAKSDLPQEARISGNLQEEAPILQKELIYLVLTRMAGAAKDLTMTHVMEVLDLWKLQSGRKISLPYSLEAVREYEDLAIRRRTDGSVHAKRKSDEKKCAQEKSVELDSAFWKRLKQEGEITLSKTSQEALGCEILGEDRLRMRCFAFSGKMDEIPTKPCTKWLDYDRLKEGCVVRSRESGDVLTLDASGHRKKLKAYLIEEKIPAGERNRVPVLAKGQEILWVMGYRLGETAKVKEGTEYIIEITYERG